MNFRITVFLLHMSPETHEADEFAWEFGGIIIRNRKQGKRWYYPAAMIKSVFIEEL